MRRGLEDVWQPPGAAAISVAVVVPGYVFYSCAGGKASQFDCFDLIAQLR
jgi:hypothetical protein